MRMSLFEETCVDRRIRSSWYLMTFIVCLLPLAIVSSAASSIYFSIPFHWDQLTMRNIERAACFGDVLVWSHTGFEAVSYHDHEKLD